MVAESKEECDSKSLGFEGCTVTLPKGDVIHAKLYYVVHAYQCGTDLFPANFVKFGAEQCCLIDCADLVDGLGADFVAECINYAIAEGNDVRGEIEEIHAAGSILWRLI